MRISACIAACYKAGGYPKRHSNSRAVLLARSSTLHLHACTEWWSCASVGSRNAELEVADTRISHCSNLYFNLIPLYLSGLRWNEAKRDLSIEGKAGDASDQAKSCCLLPLPCSRAWRRPAGEQANSCLPAVVSDAIGRSPHPPGLLAVLQLLLLK